MNRRIAIAAALAALATGALAGAASAQYRGQNSDDDRRQAAPFLRGPQRDYYGGSGERLRSLPPAATHGREPLPDGQIWAIAKSRVPGRIVNARLQGPVYSFRILSNRGSIVDVVVDRYSGRVVSVRGGP